jgi:hypothetical protein
MMQPSASTLQLSSGQNIPAPPPPCTPTHGTKKTRVELVPPKNPNATARTIVENERQRHIERLREAATFLAQDREQTIGRLEEAKCDALITDAARQPSALETSVEEALRVLERRTHPPPHAQNPTTPHTIAYQEPPPCTTTGGSMLYVRSMMSERSTAP